MFQPALAIIKFFSPQNTFKTVLYTSNSRDGLLMKRSHHQNSCL